MERDEVRPADVAACDLVVSIGGDGTALMAAMAIEGNTPLLGINRHASRVLWCPHLCCYCNCCASLTSKICARRKRSDPTGKGNAGTMYRSRQKEDSRRSTGQLCAAGPRTMEAVRAPSVGVGRVGW